MVCYIITLSDFSVLSPLSNYPKIKQAHIHDSGFINEYRYEVLCNGRSGDQRIPFSFVLYQGSKKQKVMMIQEEGEGFLSQIFLRCYTAMGTQIDSCSDSLEEKIYFSISLAKRYIDNPQSFAVVVEENAEPLSPPLDYFPLLRSSQLIETSNIGAYRYELHTQCSSLQRIQYHHVLFCYAPFQEKPCFVVSAESFGEMGPSLGVFHNKGHSNLGAKPNLLDINFFRDEAFSLVHRELLKKDVTEKDGIPDIRKGEILEKGLIGSFRCALYTELPAQNNVVFFHAFALFRGEVRQPDFLFVLEKQKYDPTPRLILYRNDTRNDLGFEDCFLDVKLFRDRVVSLLKLMLREEVFHKTQIQPLSAIMLLRLQRFFELTQMSVLFSLVVVVWGSLASAQKIETATLTFLLEGTHALTLLCAAMCFRYAKTSALHTLFYVLILALPFFSPILLPVSLFSFGALYRSVAHEFYHAQLEYNWIGLSHSSRSFLHNIMKSHT